MNYRFSSLKLFRRIKADYFIPHAAMVTSSGTINIVYCHILTQDMFNFAYVINPKCNKSYLPGYNNLIRITWGCNNVCRITWGV